MNMFDIFSHCIPVNNPLISFGFPFVSLPENISSWVRYLNSLNLLFNLSFGIKIYSFLILLLDIIINGDIFLFSSFS